MKKMLMAVVLVALMGTAAFAQAPAQQQTTAKTEQVKHEKHAKHSKKHVKHHKKGGKKAHKGGKKASGNK